MNNVKLIKRYFDFLKHKGFKRRIITRNGDAEITYSNKRISIEISFGLSVPYIPLTDTISVNDMLNSSAYFVSVTISCGYQGGNILYCNLFDKEDRVKLKSDVNSAGKDVELVLKTYAQFLKDKVKYFS